MKKRSVFIGIGSNLGDRLAYLQLAVAELPDVMSCSSVYETEPVGGPDGQPPYLNAVVRLFTARSPREILAIAQQIEASAKRVRTIRNGPRTLDIDVLCIDGETIAETDLEVPHPRMWGRRFVMQPLHDIAPEIVPKDWVEHLEPGEVRRTDLLISRSNHTARTTPS